MSTLTTQLRNKLERTVIEARDAAEAGAKEALESLAVHHHEPYGHMDPEARQLRRHLRARARQLGDKQDKAGRLDMRHIVHECAYEYWHRMLFARFLAENDLLIDLDMGVAITLAECEELARDASQDKWIYASHCAQDMLPQIFRPDDPLLKIPFAANHRIQLESLLDALAQDTFTATDAIGWVYQFWQSKKKDEVNASGNKIGADELPAVTQLFTEDYMVDFLLDNTLGAWWAGKVAGASSSGITGTTEEQCRKACALPACEWKYLRFVKVAGASSSGRGERNSGSKPELEAPATIAPDWETLKIQQGDNLPHWTCDNAIYHVCFRLADSIPQATLDEWRQEREDIIATATQADRDLSEDEEKRLRYLYSEKIEKYLDASHGECWLENPDIAKLVAGALGYFDGERYRLHAWSIMPNHVHAIVEPTSGNQLGRIVHSWKSFTSNKANEILGRTGQFWQHEPYDHIIRSEKEYRFQVRYVWENPDKAGLKDWPWRKVAGASSSGESGRSFQLRNAEEPEQDAPATFDLPQLNIACCGLEIGGTKEEWCALAPGSNFIMNQVYDLFRNASTLGSLIDPASQVKTGVGGPDIGSLKDAILQGLETFRQDQDFERQELGVSGGGVLDAFVLLTRRYHLVATNVPYLARGKQDENLKAFVERNYAKGKRDLATAFVQRCLAFCSQEGVTALVTPQSWLFLGSYKSLRTHLLQNVKWCCLARLGPCAFSTISGHVVNVALSVLCRSSPDSNHLLAGLDVAEASDAQRKARCLETDVPVLPRQEDQCSHIDSRISLVQVSCRELLSDHVRCHQGLATGDLPRFGVLFWELPAFAQGWVPWQGTVDATRPYGGRSSALLWEHGRGQLHAYNELAKAVRKNTHLRGSHVRGHLGVLVVQMRHLPVTLYTGEHYDDNTTVLLPAETRNLPALWAFCSSNQYAEAVRQFDGSLKVPAATLAKVPFDLEHWAKVAEQEYPHGLPDPESDDPTQWLFHGFPVVAGASSSGSPEQDAPATLQIATARLLGYRWPAELDAEMRLSDRARTLVASCADLIPFADPDGIVCIPSVRGEDLAADRLLALLRKAYGEAWTDTKVRELIAATGSKARNLDDWLRNDFFEQHCKLFHHRPFIWHLWDGRKRDGFHALVNYHNLAEGKGEGRKVLEKLTHSYLGDWISRQKDGVARGEGGAEDRLAAAVELQNRLLAILKGDPPFDIFVRWKPLHQQAIGWNPDINDGVRLNMRPFMANDLPHSKKGAGILRWKPNVKWGKDRGKEPQRPKDEYPWFWSWNESTQNFMGSPEFDGNRWNDLHYTNAAKEAARKKLRETKDDQ